MRYTFTFVVVALVISAVVWLGWAILKTLYDGKQPPDDGGSS